MIRPRSGSVKANAGEVFSFRECLRMTESGHIVAIGLGSNLGDRQGNLTGALQRLRKVIHIQSVSPVYETTPVGYTDQPDFLNLVCTGATALSPHELSAQLSDIERRVGRTPSFPIR